MELNQFIKCNELSTGRRLFAMGRVLPGAQARSLEQLVLLVQEAMAHDRGTYQLDLRWDALRIHPQSMAIIGPLDARVDRVIRSMRDGAMGQAEGAEEGHPIHQTVKGFLAAVLPAGVYAITSKPYVEQLTALEDIVEKLEGPLAPTVTELRLETQAARLSELLPAYRDAINGAANGNNALQFATVRAARQRGQRYLHEIIAMILGTYYRADDPEHQAARAELLGPIVEQHEAVRDYLRARRAVRDVDPDTGEIEPEPVEPEEPAGEEPAAGEPAA